MDKILSTRVEESAVLRIGQLAQELHTSKKAIIEAAIRYYGEKIDKEKNTDIFEQTMGAWQRDETPEDRRDLIRDKFNKSMERNKR